MGYDLRNPRANCGIAVAYGKRITPDNVISGHEAFRAELIRRLTGRESVRADAVVPIPHAGVFLARSWGKLRPEALWLAFGAERYNTSMFRVATQFERDEHAWKKVGAVKQKKDYRSVVLLDETIMSGTTMRTAIQTLRLHGVGRIYARTLFPPISKMCPHGVLTYVPGSGYVRDWYSESAAGRIADALDADDYASLPVEDIVRIRRDRVVCVSCVGRLSVE